MLTYDLAPGLCENLRARQDSCDACTARCFDSRLGLPQPLPISVFFELECHDIHSFPSTLVKRTKGRRECLGRDHSRPNGRVRTQWPPRPELRASLDAASAFNGLTGRLAWARNSFESSGLLQRGKNPLKCSKSCEGTPTVPAGTVGWGRNLQQYTDYECDLMAIIAGDRWIFVHGPSFLRRKSNELRRSGDNFGDGH